MRPQELLGPDVFVTFDVYKPMGRLVQDLGGGQATGNRMEVRLGQHSEGGRQGDEGSLPGVWGAGILAVRPPEPAAQGRRQGFRLEDGS